MFRYFSTSLSFKNNNNKKKEQFVHRYTCNLTFSLLWEVLEDYLSFWVCTCSIFGVLEVTLTWSVASERGTEDALQAVEFIPTGMRGHIITAWEFLQQYPNPYCSSSQLEPHTP